MTVYLALGDSISIDDYTGVHGGGAPSQLARKLGLELIDLTRDGNTTDGVLADLAAAPAAADVVTITAGGNDLLGGDLPRAILRRLDQIAQRIEPLGACVVLNTIYDPSDCDNDLGRLPATQMSRNHLELDRGADRDRAAAVGNHRGVERVRRAIGAGRARRRGRLVRVERSPLAEGTSSRFLSSPKPPLTCANADEALLGTC